VFLYAVSGAAKEQWYLTLAAQTSPTGQEATVRGMYREYAMRMGGAAEALGISQLLSVTMPEAAADGPEGKPLEHQRQGKPPLQHKNESDVSAADGIPAGRASGRRFGWLIRLIPGRRGNKGRLPAAAAGPPHPPSTSTSMASLPKADLVAPDDSDVMEGSRARTSHAPTGHLPQEDLQGDPLNSVTNLEASS